MKPERLIELEMAANAHPGNRSSAMILELVEEVRRLQKRNAKRAGFVAPTVEEVAEYFASGEVFVNGKALETAEEFVVFYTNRKWRLTKGIQMSDWKLTCQTWERNAKKKAAPTLSRTVAEPRM